MPWNRRAPSTQRVAKSWTADQAVNQRRRVARGRRAFRLTPEHRFAQQLEGAMPGSVGPAAFASPENMTRKEPG
jgi:hypothetical protein